MKTATLTLLVLAILAFASPVTAVEAPGLPDLFGPQTIDKSLTLSADASQSAGAPVFSQETERVNFEAVMTKEMTVRLEGAARLAVRTEMYNRPDGYTWVGMVDGSKMPSVITVKNGVMAATLFAADGIYVVTPGFDPSRHVVSHVDPSSLALLKDDAVQPFWPGARLARAAVKASTTVTAPSPLLPVHLRKLFVYTGAAADAAGGDAQLQAVLQNGEDLTNAALRNSHIGNVTIAVSSMQRINYQESGDQNANLAWVATNATVAQLREQYRAHLVTLVTESGGSVATRPTTVFAKDFGFSVVTRLQAMYQMAIPHEDGHAFGADHDSANQLVPPAHDPYPYARGYVNAAAGIRDFMSYSSPNCPTCTMVPYYSSPGVQVNGVAIGVAGTTDNAKMIRVGAPLVAAYYPDTTTTCVPSPTTLCLQASRIKVEVAWRTPDGNSGLGQVIPATVSTQSGDFWFFDPTNTEMLIKVLDAGSRYWVFYSGLTNVEVTVVVTDTVSGASKTYHNDAGPLMVPNADFSTFTK